LFVGLFILGSILVGTSTLLGFAAGGPAKCKKALAELAAKHAWKHEGAEYKMTQGRIDEKIAGRDVEIDPDDDYAIEVELHDSPFDLKTDPQWSSPRDGLQRFSTGDPRFDNLFPIRYATPELVARMAESPEPLAPIYWFLDRWEPKIANMKIDWSEVGVHLLPGGLKADRHSTRYLEPQDVEPLLEDMLVLAKAIDAVAHGRTPELPRQRAFQGYRDPGQALRTGGGYGGAGVSMNARHS
jgi:hypothetical protein